MLSQRRRHSRWRMFLILSVFLGLVCSGELAPTSVSDSSSSSSHTRRKSQDIGSLSDFTWQAWIVMDPQYASQSGMDSATITRKITPKSVFIAPALLPCPEDYKADSMNRCVKNAINVNEDAHISFLLQRLNTMYANQDFGNKGDQKKSTGPLQLNIPLIPNFSSEKLENEDMIGDSIAVPARNQTLPEDEEKTKLQHATVAYEVKNDTTPKSVGKETTIFLQNSSIPHLSKAEEKPNTVIVMAELVDETNDTDFTQTVLASYKKPLAAPLYDALSVVERVDESDAAKNVTKDVSTMDTSETSTKTSTAVTSLSPTKLPSDVDDSPSTQKDSAHLFTQTTKEIIIKVPDPTPSTTKETTEIPLIAEDEHRDNETYDASNDATPTNWKLNESEDIFYEEETEEDTTYSSGSTDEPDDEKLLEVEEGEILKAGEAGITIPAQHVERLHRDQQQQQNRTTEQKETVDTRDQIVIRFNDSTPTNDKDEADSNVSSEVSIRGDLILETTLLDMSTERLQVSTTTTKSPVVTQKSVKDKDGDSKESFDRNLGYSKSRVVFPQDSDSAMFTSLYHGSKEDERVVQVKNEKIEKLQVAPPSSPGSLLFDSPAADPITEIDEEETDYSKGSALRESPQRFESEVFPTSGLRQIMMNLGANFVRFPSDYAKQPAQQSGHVRFPSNEANSIHSPSYKQHPYYVADGHDAIYGGGGGGGGSVKSSVSGLQKPVYLSAPNWKPDRIDRSAIERQKQSPGLLGFWSSMPLIKDPAMYPFDQANEAISSGGQSFFPASSRAMGFYVKTSTADDVDRVYTQKQRRTAAIVA